MVNATNETRPITCDGKSLWNGNRNPVKLVATVVAKNSVVHLSSCFEEISPNTTTNPAAIPTKLNATWKNVNIAIPKLMMCLFSFEKPVEIGQCRIDPES